MKKTTHMYFKTIFSTALFLCASLILPAQESTGLQSEIRKMSKETDPLKSVTIRNRIIHDFKLDSLKDSETIDLLNGNVAIAYAMKRNHEEFEKYISLIKNKFNQTSMMSMAANQLLDQNIDAEFACEIAKETLEKYSSFKDDPDARPEGYTKEDWTRFMGFAKYPYNDTYAKSLFAAKRYQEAIHYQRLAFDGKPEDGLPSSVERYAKLLELNGDRENSKQLLLKVAGMGKLNQGMIAQLESFYVSERGSNKNFDAWLDSLQNGIQDEMISELRKNMLNEKAPPFSLNDINGKRVRLADYKGKIVILDLWATWCAPCIAAFPAMQKLVEKHPDVVFLFIAVNEKKDNALERVKNFITKNRYPFHVLLDEPINGTPDKYVITSSYHPDGIPAKYFIDREGKLRFKSKGFSSDTELINETDAIINILESL